MDKAPSNSSYFFLATGVVIGAFILRLMGLKKGIWLDEYITLRILSSRDFIQALRLHDHPSLYYILLKLWSQINASDVFLRLFSVFCGMGTVVALMGWIKQHSRPASLLAGLYAATLPLMLRYSQEIVDYPLFLFAVALSFFCASRVLMCPGSRAGTVGLTLSLTAAVLSHAVGIAIVPTVGVYLLSARPSATVIDRRRVAFAFGIPVCVFVFVVHLFLQGIKKEPGSWWVPPISLEGLVYFSKALFGLTQFFNFTGRLFSQSIAGPAIFLVACIILFFSGDWRRSWPLLAAAVFYWLALVGYSLWVVPVFLERTALPGMIPFMGFVGVHISSVRKKALRISLVISMIFLSAIFLYSWILTADKPIERTRETALMLNGMRESKDILLFFPGSVEGLFEHYISLPSDSVLSIKVSDDVGVVEEKIGRMLRRQESGLSIKPRSVFLVMRFNPLLKRKPQAYVWLLEYLRSRFGKPVFSRKFGVFLFMQYQYRET